MTLGFDQLVAWGALYYAYNVLSGPLAREAQVSTKLVAAAFSCTLLVAGALARVVGRAADRRGARRVLVAGALVGASALAMLAVASGPVWIAIAFVTLGVAQSLSLYEPAFRAVVDWFPAPRERSRALLIVTTLGSLASTAFLPLAAALEARLGVRVAFGVLALGLLAVALPLRLALAPMAQPPPTEAERRADRPTPDVAARLLGVGLALQSFAATGAMLCLVAHLVALGHGVGSAALLTGLAGASQMIGRLLIGPLQRAVRSKLRLPALFLLQALALALVASGSAPLVLPLVVLFGAASGAMTLERAAIAIEWFGTRDFGARSGGFARLALVARAAAPYAVEVLSSAITPARALLVLAGVVVLAAALAVAGDRARCGALSRADEARPR